MENKAKLIRNYYQKDRSRICEYSYRGYSYYITFNEYGVYDGIFLDVTGAHKYEQNRIDERIGRESQPQKPYTYENSAQAGFDAFWNYAEIGEFKINKG